MKPEKRQSSSVVCKYSLADWEINSSGQTACSVYAQLGAICEPGFTVNPITKSSFPYSPTDNDCQCNIVAYNLMSGCGWCQEGIDIDDLLTLPEWKGNCTMTAFNDNKVADSIDTAGINIPSWALLVPTGVAWNPYDAESVATSSSSSIQASATGHVSSPYVSTIVNAGTSTRPFPTDVGDTTIDDSGGSSTSTIAISVAAALIVWLIASVIVGIVYRNRQKKRIAWYRPTAQFYQNGGSEGGSVPLMYAQETSAGGVYPPTRYKPPPLGTNPFDTPSATPHTIPGTPASTANIPLTLMESSPSPVPSISPGYAAPIPTFHTPPAGPPPGAAAPSPPTAIYRDSSAGNDS